MNSQATVKTTRWEEQAAKLWKISAEINDYFAKLGGSGRYSGFYEWHGPALLLLLVSGVDPTRKDFLQSEESYLIHPRLWRETESLVEETNRRLIDLKMSPAVFDDYLNSVTKRLCELNSETSQLLGWMKFIAENSDRFRSFIR